MTEITLSNESRFIKFSLLVIFGIISTICSLYIIYNVLKFPSFRQRFHNQTLIILVCLVLCNIFFNIPTTFSFYARGYVSPESELFCDVWQILDYIFTACIIWCKAIFTIERYILVFHPNYLRSQRQKFLLHSIPLISINLYLILFYIFSTLFGSCEDHPEFARHLCGDQCLDQPRQVSTFNWLFNILFPVFIIIFGSLVLLLRVLWIRREMQRNLRNWSKNWKMIIQLLGIAIVYTIVWFPLSIISLITMLYTDHKAAENIAIQFYFITYLCEMSVPIIALLFWPEMMQRIRRHIQPNAVASITMGPYSTN